MVENTNTTEGHRSCSCLTYLLQNITNGQSDVNKKMNNRVVQLPQRQYQEVPISKKKTNRNSHLFNIPVLPVGGIPNTQSTTCQVDSPVISLSARRRHRIGNSKLTTPQTTSRQRVESLTERELSSSSLFTKIPAELHAEGSQRSTRTTSTQSCTPSQPNIPLQPSSVLSPHSLSPRTSNAEFTVVSSNLSINGKDSVTAFSPSGPLIANYYTAAPAQVVQIRRPKIVSSTPNQGAALLCFATTTPSAVSPQLTCKSLQDTQPPRPFPQIPQSSEAAIPSTEHLQTVPFVSSIPPLAIQTAVNLSGLRVGTPRTPHTPHLVFQTNSVQVRLDPNDSALTTPHRNSAKDQPYYSQRTPSKLSITELPYSSSFPESATCVWSPSSPDNSISERNKTPQPPLLITPPLPGVASFLVTPRAPRYSPMIYEVTPELLKEQSRQPAICSFPITLSETPRSASLFGPASQWTQLEGQLTASLHPDISSTPSRHLHSPYETISGDHAESLATGSPKHYVEERNWHEDGLEYKKNYTDCYNNKDYADDYVTKSTYNCTQYTNEEYYGCNNNESLVKNNSFLKRQKPFLNSNESFLDGVHESASYNVNNNSNSYIEYNAITEADAHHNHCHKAIPKTSPFKPSSNDVSQELPSLVNPPNPVRLFVGRIPKQFRSSDLKKIFEVFGIVLECNIIRDRRSSQSKGCGFVKLPSVEAAKDAIATLNQSCQLDPDLGLLQVKFASGELERLGLPLSLQPGGECVKVFFGNLSPTTSEDELHGIFGQFGEFEELCVLRDRNRRSKCKYKDSFEIQTLGFTVLGSGFITFRSMNIAQKCINKLNGQYQVMGAPRSMEVRLAESRTQRSSKALATQKTSSNDFGGSSFRLSSQFRTPPRPSCSITNSGNSNKEKNRSTAAKQKLCFDQQKKSLLEHDHYSITTVLENDASFLPSNDWNFCNNQQQPQYYSMLLSILTESSPFLPTNMETRYDNYCLTMCNEHQNAHPWVVCNYQQLLMDQSMDGTPREDLIWEEVYENKNCYSSSHNYSRR